MKRNLPKIALAILIAIAPPAAAQQGSTQFRIKLFEDGQGASPGASTQSRAVTYPTTIAGKVGVDLTAQPATSGIEGGSSFAATTGTIPNGLTIDPSNGAISGQPQGEGTYGPIVVTATGPDNQTSSNAFQITVVAQSLSYPSATTAPAGSSVAIAPTVGNAESPRFTLLAGTLPDGLSVDLDTGVIGGVPTQQGTFPNLRVFAFGADGATSTSNAFSITVNTAPSPATASMQDASGTVGAAFSASPSSAGFPSAPTWTLAGSLPPGLGLNGANGAITGVPQAAGTTTGLVLTATANGQSASTGAFQIAIAPPAAAATAFFPTPVNGQVGTPLNATATHANFTTAPTWSLTGAPLPAGLTLDPSSGAISGSPSVEGTTNGIVLTATAGAQSAATNAFSIVVAPAPAQATITYPASTTLVRGISGAVSPTVTGGSGTIAYAVAGGTIPPGMQIDPATGQISGVPTTAATHAGITVTATGAWGSATSQAFAITIAAPSASGPGNQAASIGSPFTSTTPTTNIVGATWTIASGTLPSGLSLNPGSGVVSGTPSTGATSSTGLSLTATAGGATATTATFQISIATISSPTGTPTQASPYSTTFTASGLGGTITWSVGGGTTLPGGLTLSTGGVLSGTPTGKGAQAPFTVVATSSNGATVSKPITLTVTPYFTQAQPTGWVVGDYNFNDILSFAGATPSPNPWTYTVVNGEGLPPGLMRDNDFRGRILGTPWEAGTFTGAVIRATNGTTGAVIDSDPMTFTVAPAPGAPIEMPQPEGGMLVFARGIGGTLLAQPDPSLGLSGSDFLYIRPLVRAGSNGLVNGQATTGVNIAPWGPTETMRANGSLYATGEDKIFGRVATKAQFSTPGIYPITLIVGDTMRASKTGRAGFLSLTVKVFNVQTVAGVLSASAVPASTSPAAGTVLTTGMSADLNYSTDMLGTQAIIYCTVGQTAAYSVHSLLPDGTWLKVATKGSESCHPSVPNYSTPFQRHGIGKTFRVVVESGTLTWNGGRVGTSATYSP